MIAAPLMSWQVTTCGLLNGSFSSSYKSALRLVYRRLFRTCTGVIVLGNMADTIASRATACSWDPCGTHWTGTCLCGRLAVAARDNCTADLWHEGRSDSRWEARVRSPLRLSGRYGRSHRRIACNAAGRLGGGSISTRMRRIRGYFGLGFVMSSTRRIAGNSICVMARVGWRQRLA